MGTRCICTRLLIIDRISDDLDRLCASIIYYKLNLQQGSMMYTDIKIDCLLVLFTINCE